MTAVMTPSAALTGTLTRLLRQMAAIKAHVGARQRHGVEWSAYPVLMHLVSAGPMRSSALAELVCSDPSTVSRQAAALVEVGFVDRLPDPHDGRACQLTATDRGRAVFEQMLLERDQLMSTVLQDWADADVDTLVRLLDRLTADLDHHRPALLTPHDTLENPDDH
jgi:DNA-binding MarR family transcriptional regulator